MAHHKMKIAGIDCTLPLCPINDNLYIAAFIMLGNTKLSQACAKELLKVAPSFDCIITAEAKGIALAHEMARLSGLEHYLVARKSTKLYMQGILTVDVKSITTAGDQKLYIDSADAESMRSKRVLVVDDVISTGESLAALCELVRVAGGEIAGKMCVLAEGEAQRMEGITYLEPLPLFGADGRPLY